MTSPSEHHRRGTARRRVPLPRRERTASWRDHDYRNSRKRHFRPTAGLTQARPYDLRHSFASLMLREGRVGDVDLASRLGHSPTMTLTPTVT